MYRTNGWVSFTLLSEMPSYLADELGYTISNAGVYSTIPYICLFILTIVSGKAFTYCMTDYNWSIRRVRLTLLLFQCY